MSDDLRIETLGHSTDSSDSVGQVADSLAASQERTYIGTDMTHDPMCPLSKPCHPSFPEHNDLGGLLSGCDICEKSCICDTIAKVREDERRRFDDDGADRDIRNAALRDAVEAVKIYANETHKHFGDLFGHCRQEYGDRCDITSALEVAAQKIEYLGGEQ